MGFSRSRDTVFLYLAAGAVFAAVAARGLMVPLYAHDLGATKFEIGALWSVSAFAAALLSLPSGLLVDRFGPRKLLGTSFLLLVGSQLAIAATTSVAPLFLWQVIGGLAAGMQQSAIFSAVTETVDRSRLGRTMGWVTLSMQGGFTIGPAVAGLALRWIGLRADLAITSALLAVAIPAALTASRTRQHTGSGLALRGPLLALVRESAFVPVTVGLVAATLVWGTVGAFLPVFGKEALGLAGWQVGALLGLQAVVNAASRLPGGWLVDHARRRWPIVFVGVIGWSASTIALGHLSGFAGPALVLAAGTPFMATAFVAIGVVFGDMSSASTRGVAMGTYGTILFAGLAAGPLVSGPIVQSAGYAAGFTAAAAAAIALVAVMAALQLVESRSRTAPAPRGDSEKRPAATRRA